MTICLCMCVREKDIILMLNSSGHKISKKQFHSPPPLHPDRRDEIECINVDVDVPG